MSYFLRCAALIAVSLMLVQPAAAAEKRYGLTSFDTIVVNADFIVEVTTRSPVSAVAVGSSDALDRVSVVADNGTLTISKRQFAGDENRRGPLGPVTIKVNAAFLRSATLIGAGSLTIDRMKGAKVVIGVRGPGQLSVAALTADRLEVGMIGNGTMTLGGTAKRAQLTLSGAGVVDAGALSVADLISDSEGSGDHIFSATKTAAITTRGVGSTVVRGRPTCTVRNAGSGSVQCGATK